MESILQLYLYPAIAALICSVYMKNTDYENEYFWRDAIWISFIPVVNYVVIVATIFILIVKSEKR